MKPAKKISPEQAVKNVEIGLAKLKKDNDCSFYITIEKNYLTGQETPRINIVHNSMLQKK